MTNKLRRSMTSVLLAASLLFSSQSVVAFADYGSKSDASDLSPVQESVENATEEQQEDPSLSVEPVIGESTEAPVATPMIARANAPVAYSAPEVSGYSLYRYYDYFNEPEPDTVSVYITDGVENYGTVYESAYEIGGFDAFTSGSSWQSYTIDANSFKNNDWIFKGWSYKLTQNNDNHDLGNITDNAVGRRYTFGDGRNSVDAWCHQYNGGETISIHALWRTGLLGSHIEEKSTLHHSIYANFNPLVTVDVGENGKVTYNNTEVSHEDSGKKVEVEYGTAPDFTITPDTGYKVASVTFGDTTIQANEDGTYPLPSVTEPTTLEVTFDKTEEQPFWTFNADENGSVKWNDKEPTNSIVFTKSEVEKLKGNDGIKDFIYAVPDENYGFAGWTGTDWQGNDELCLENLNPDNSYNSTAHFNPLVNITFNPGDHGTLVNSSESTGTITSGYDMAYLAFPEVTPEKGYRLVGWKRDGSSEIETISVKTPVAYVENGITYTAQYEEVPAEQIEHIEINLGDNLRKEIPFAPIYLHAEYDGDYIFLTGTNKHFTTPPVSSIPDTLTTDVDDPTKAQEFFSGFTCLGWNFAFDKHYISNAYISEARVEGTTLYMTLDIPAPEAPANINELLDVTLNCENPDHPEEYAKSKTYSDLLPNSYTIGEVKNNDGTYTCDITINPEEYLADYNNVTKTNHILVTTPENLTGIATVTLKYEDGAWKTAESPVTFTVTCKQSIPLTPSKPSDDVVKAIMDKISVTVDCTNTTGHDPMNHTLTGAEFTVGDIYSVAPFAGKDPVILCPVTINNYVSLQNGFITQYNAATNEPHTLSSGFIPASIVLTYNKDAQDGKGAWENHDLENITLSLTCNPTTPGGGGEGTNPGGNGGDNDDDDDRYTGDNTVTRTINDDDVPLNDRPTNTTTIDDEDVPLADLPDDTVTIDDGEVPLKANPSTGDSLPFAAMAAAALSLGGVIVLNRKKK